MSRGRRENTGNHHEDALLRPPEPEAVGSNPALPDSNSFLNNADITIEGGIQGFSRLLAAERKFDSIFCVNDLCALGVVDAAEKHGYKVGKDLAVMGIDNLEMAAVSRISLTSIDQAYDRIIELATRSLIGSIEKKEPCRIRKKLKPSLIVRDSTRLVE
jgi:LacI family transcriptional regulator